MARVLKRPQSFTCTLTRSILNRHEPYQTVIYELALCMQAARTVGTALSVCTSVSARTADLVTRSTVDVRALPAGQDVSANSVTARPACLSLSRLSRCWWHSIVVRPLVSAGELSLSCARLLAGWVTTLWLSRPLSVSQHGQLSHPSLRGR